MKIIHRFLCAGMAVLMLFAFAACSSGDNGSGLSEVGTWQLTELSAETITQGMLLHAVHNTITLFSDNTFVLTCVYDTDYSSDGGETFNPISYVDRFVHGKYEVVGSNEELGEQTIKITEITQVSYGDYDSVASATDEDKDAIKNNEVVGMEVILTSDHSMSEMISIMAFLNIGPFEMSF